jgi:hypothetical protein
MGRPKGGTFNYPATRKSRVGTRGPRSTRFQLCCSTGFRDWFEEFREAEKVKDCSWLMGQAIREYAKARGFREPPER